MNETSIESKIKLHFKHCEIWRIEQTSRTHKIRRGHMHGSVICIVLYKSNTRTFNEKKKNKPAKQLIQHEDLERT